MAVTTSNNNVVITAGGANLNDIIGFTSHFKTYDNSYTVLTTTAGGATASGSIHMNSTIDAGLILDSSNTFCMQRMVLDGTVDYSTSRAYASVKGCKLVFTSNEIFTVNMMPLVSNSGTDILYKGRGCCWNARSPKVNMIGSRVTFEGFADGQLSKDPNAVVKDVTFTIKSSNNDNAYMMGLLPGVKANGEVDTVPGLRFISVNGNNKTYFYSWSNATNNHGVANTGFDVRPDYCYDVALPGFKPSGIGRDFRRATFTLNANSIYGNTGTKRIAPVVVWVDPYTTLNEQGVLDSGKFYLNKVLYSGGNTGGGDNAADIIVYRWKPRFISFEGIGLKHGYCAVSNNDRLIPEATAIGDNSNIINKKVLAYGIIENGFFNNDSFVNRNSRPISEVYANYSDYSFMTANHVDNTIPHTYNEPKIKLIKVYDNTGTVGVNNTNLISGVNFERPKIHLRAKGHIFFSRDLNTSGTAENGYRMTGPIVEEIQLQEDLNYTMNYSGSDASLVTVNVTKEKCIVNLGNGDISLDIIYNKIIDAYVPLLIDGINLPITQNNNGILDLSANVELVTSNNTVLVAGNKVKHIRTHGEINFKTKGIGIVHETMGNLVSFHSKTSMNILAKVFRETDSGLELVSEQIANSVTTITVGVHTGNIVKIAAWSLGKAGYYNEFKVSSPFDYDIQWTDYTNGILDLSIDVEETLNNCELTLGLDGVTLALPAGIYTDAYSKMLLHRMVGTRVGLEATLAGGNNIASRIDGDRFYIYQPSFKLVKKSNLTARDTCATELFLDFTAAKDINPRYVVNPSGANGRVEIPLRPILVSPEDISHLVISNLVKHPQFITTTHLNLMESNVLTEQN